MPLESGSSRAAISKNKMAAGKPQKQAVAIAYSKAGKDEAQPGMVTTPNAGTPAAGRPKRAADASGGTPSAGTRATSPSWPGRVV